MASARIQITRQADELLRKFSPDDQKEVIGVLIMLAADRDGRNQRKFDINLQRKDGRTTWGWETEDLWIAFVDLNDQDIAILHFAFRNPGFRPPGPHPYSPGAFYEN